MKETPLFLLCYGGKLRNQPMAHQLICCLGPDCLQRMLRQETGCPVRASQRLWISYPGSSNHAWSLVLGLQFCRQAYSLQRTWMAWEWETGWCIRGPSSASPSPPPLSSLIQDLDPPAPEGFPARAGHKPAVRCKTRNTFFIISTYGQKK